MSRKTVTTFLRIKVGGHFVMSIVKCYESHYVGVLDNPPSLFRLIVLRTTFVVLCGAKYHFWKPLALVVPNMVLSKLNIQ